MYILYELGILFARYLARNRPTEAAAQETAGSGE